MQFALGFLIFGTTTTASAWSVIWVLGPPWVS